MAQQPPNDDQKRFWDGDFLEIEPEPEGREKALRDFFVVEFLKDYDPVLAAMRCGFMRAFAEEYAVRFMGESYVQRKIKNDEFTDPANAKVEAADDKRKILVGLRREANYRGPGASASSRVAALAQLARIHGMDVVKKDKGTGTNRGGVMVVPGIADIDEWEKVASESQDKLVADART